MSDWDEWRDELRQQQREMDARFRQHQIDHERRMRRAHFWQMLSSVLLVIALVLWIASMLARTVQP